MDFEARTQQVLMDILPRVDEFRAGWCIEAGAGTGNWYWQRFVEAQYRTLVIEPQPVQDLVHWTNVMQTPLISAALNDAGGTATLYVGRDGDANLGGLDRLHWAATDNTLMVSAVTYAALLNRYDIHRVTCLKLDIEGAEYRVIGSLNPLPQRLLPKVLCFEYGGGEARRAGLWAWSPPGVARLEWQFGVLQQMGYRQALALDGAQPPRAALLQGDSAALIDTLFSDDASCGNCIVVRESVELEQYCEPF